FVSSPPESVKAGAIGRVVPGYVAQIVDDDMNPVPNGTVGRLAHAAAPSAAKRFCMTRASSLPPFSAG
ncbi:hypothetical protein DAI43_36075, partial [Achromobacter xylosoxidans]